MKFEVLGIFPDRSMLTIKKVNTEKAALRLAANESLKKAWHEVTVYQYDQAGDICGHWYYKAGKQTISIF